MSESKNNFLSIEEIPPPFRSIFSDYPCFNIVQSEVLNEVLYSDKSIVVSSPTGSGKTVIFELAIVKLLMQFNNNEDVQDLFKIVYISPIKSLCQERLVDWRKKFSPFGLKTVSVTGDSDNMDFESLANHNLILTTPEKWDSLTRRWRDNEKIVEVVKLFMIDEVHLLNEENRGSTLEVIVSRMKTVENSLASSRGKDRQKIRFLALSATIPNVSDIADWMGKPPNVTFFQFSEDVRPVKLKKIVLGYNYNSKKISPFKFDLSLNYKLQFLMMQHSEGKPTLIFCSTRKSVEMCAKHLIQSLRIQLNPVQSQKLANLADLISDVKAKETVKHGVGYHHAGLIPETRHAIEEAFRRGELPVLVTTSTLAMGVNLPAHLVIIKSTKCYDNCGFRDYTEIALHQMMGRAGRPQFDTSATVLILTTNEDKAKFERMVACNQPIESNLHRHLTEHLNAEVVLRTITDLDVAMQWLASTFLYVRARKHPNHYGLAVTLKKEQIDKKLLEMCQIDLNKLMSAGMITMNQNIIITPTKTGELMAKYYVAFETMKLFTQITGTEILMQILALISKCHEFSELHLRVNDKKTLNLLNKNTSKDTIRFPLNGRIKTVDMKVNCIIQAIMGNLDISDHSILSDSFTIMRNGQRIAKCLIDYLAIKGKHFYSALLNSIIMGKCFHAKLWENSLFVSKQLTGIGSVLSTLLVNAGKTSFDKILESNPRDIEMIVRKRPPMGDYLIEEVQHIPRYKITLEKVLKGNCIQMKLTIQLENFECLQEKSTINLKSAMSLLIGNNLNEILVYERYQHSYMLENPQITKNFEAEIKANLDKIEAHFISEDWVGIDCHAEVFIKDKPEKTVQKLPEKKETKQPSYIQRFLDMYMKIKKKPSKEITAGKGEKSLEKPNKGKPEGARNHKKICGEKIDVVEGKIKDIVEKVAESHAGFDFMNNNKDIMKKCLETEKIVEEDAVEATQHERRAKNDLIANKNDPIQPVQGATYVNKNNSNGFIDNALKQPDKFHQESYDIPDDVAEEFFTDDMSDYQWEVPRFCKNQQEALEISPAGNDGGNTEIAGGWEMGNGRISTPKNSLGSLSGFRKCTGGVIENHELDNAQNVQVNNASKLIQKTDEQHEVYDILDDNDDKFVEIPKTLSQNHFDEVCEVEENSTRQFQTQSSDPEKVIMNRKENECIGLEMNKATAEAPKLPIDFDSIVKNDPSLFLISQKYMHDKDAQNVTTHRGLGPKLNSTYKNTRWQNNYGILNTRRKRKGIFQDIHPAEQLEDEIYREERKQNIIDEFKKPEKKKIAHYSDEESCPDSTVNSKMYTITEMLEPPKKTRIYDFQDAESERIERERENQQKSIKWRSPLVFSPAVKFSPKNNFTYQFCKENNEGEIQNTFNDTLETSASSRNSKATPTLTLSIQKTPKKPQVTQIGFKSYKKRGTKFPLCDNDYDESPNTSKSKELDKSLDFSDICASQFLEGIQFKEQRGSTPKRYKHCKPSSAMDYYTQFMNQSGAVKEKQKEKLDKYPCSTFNKDKENIPNSSEPTFPNLSKSQNNFSLSRSVCDPQIIREQTQDSFLDPRDAHDSILSQNRPVNCEQNVSFRPPDFWAPNYRQDYQNQQSDRGFHHEPSRLQPHLGPDYLMGRGCIEEDTLRYPHFASEPQKLFHPNEIVPPAGYMEPALAYNIPNIPDFPYPVCCSKMSNNERFCADSRSMERIHENYLLFKRPNMPYFRNPDCYLTQEHLGPASMQNFHAPEFPLKQENVDLAMRNSSILNHSQVENLSQNPRYQENMFGNTPVELKQLSQRNDVPAMSAVNRSSFEERPLIRDHESQESTFRRNFATQDLNSTFRTRNSDYTPNLSHYGPNVPYILRGLSNNQVFDYHNRSFSDFPGNFTHPYHTMAPNPNYQQFSTPNNDKQYVMNKFLYSLNEQN